jgi:hypothetical protein
MNCQKCNSNHITEVCAKCSDLFSCTFSTGREYTGYVPDGFNIGSGDYVEFKYCTDCGQIQGEFPVAGFKKRL